MRDRSRSSASTPALRLERYGAEAASSPPRSVSIRGFMVEAKGRGKCLIFSTHVLHDAERLCDRVTIIHQGRVVASGTTTEVRGEYQDLEDSFLSLVEAAR